MERLFNVLVECGSWMNEQVMMKFITGKTYISDQIEEEKAERKEYEKQRDKIGLLYKMMVYAVSGVADKDLAEWNATYRTSSGKTVMLLDEILALFGFSYSKEEFYKLAEGSHDLFKEG